MKFELMFRFKLAVQLLTNFSLVQYLLRFTLRSVEVGEGVVGYTIIILLE